MQLYTPEYWPPISHITACYNSSEVRLRLRGNYQKQSFLNRCRIAGVHGVLTLSVPLSGSREQKSPFGEVLIDPSQRWAIQHLRTLQSCYGKAAYFDYYFPTIEALLSRPGYRIAELNEKLFRQAMKWLKWEGSITRLTTFSPFEMPVWCTFPSYVQVFADRQPFRPNLSILDLLFCMGPQSAGYLALFGQQTGC